MTQFVRTEKSQDSGFFDNVNKIHIPGTPKRVVEEETSFRDTPSPIRKTGFNASSVREDTPLEQWEGDLLKISSSIQKRFFRVTNHFLSYYASKSKAYESPIRNLRGTYDIKLLLRKGGLHISNVTVPVKKKRDEEEVKYSTISMKFVDGTMRHLQGTSPEIRKLYNVLKERQKWFEDVNDLGESNLKWQSEIQTAARKHYEKRIHEDRQRCDEALSVHLDTMRHDHENALVELKKIHEARLQSVRREHEEVRRRHDHNAPSVDETMKMHTTCFQHEAYCRKLKLDMEKHKFDIDEKSLELEALRTRLEALRSSRMEEIRKRHLEVSKSRSAYMSCVVKEMNDSNRQYEEESQDLGKRHHTRLEAIEVSANNVASHANSDLVAAKIVIESSHAKRVRETRNNFKSEFNMLEESIQSESTLLKSMKLRERYEHDRYVEEKRVLKSKISNAKFKVRAKHDRGLQDLKHIKFKLNSFAKDNRVLREDVSRLEDNARESTERLKEMLNLKAEQLNTLKMNYESRSREVVLENESLSKEWISNHTNDLNDLKFKLNEQRKIAIEHMQSAKDKWVRLSRGEDISCIQRSMGDEEYKTCMSRFSNISLRAMRVAEVIKSEGRRRELIVSNLRRALRDRAVDLEMALSIICDSLKHRSKLFGDDDVTMSFDRALRSIDRLLGSGLK